MTVELLQTLSLVGFLLCGLFFLVTMGLFFWLKIPKVVGDITGATARKSIESIRRQNEESGEKKYKPSFVNVSRGRLTDKISPTGTLQRRTGRLGGGMVTEKISTMKLAAESEETTILGSGSNETTVLHQQMNETTLLNMGMDKVAAGNETTVLHQSTTEAGPDFTVDIELSYLGSSELIE